MPPSPQNTNHIRPISTIFLSASGKIPVVVQQILNLDLCSAFSPSQMPLPTKKTTFSSSLCRQW